MSLIDPFDASAPETLDDEQRAQIQATQRKEAADFNWLMSDKRGRRFVRNLLEKTGVFRSSFTGNSETYFREGERNVGLRLLAQIEEFCPDMLAKMLTEGRQ